MDMNPHILIASTERIRRCPQPMETGGFSQNGDELALALGGVFARAVGGIGLVLAKEGQKRIKYGGRGLLHRKMSAFAGRGPDVLGPCLP